MNVARKKDTKKERMTDAGKVLFHLTDDALIVANSGAPFTRKGVIAVCHMHLSEKTGKPEDNYDKIDLIREIANSVTSLYQKHQNRNRIAEDANGEEALSSDYNGRSIWELLQNADDAVTVAALKGKDVSGGLIGAKGLGFKSVLEFSESPEIYSGKFRFRFSREDTQKKLESHNIQVGGDVPIFRIPHQCDPDEKCASLLKDGYATVIRLPFTGDKAEKAEKQLNKLDATCLLFCQRLSRIEIKIRGESRVIEINRGNTCNFENKPATFTLTDNNGIQKWRRWSAAWTPKDDNAEAKKLSAALCLPIEKGEEIAMDRESPVHIFFPTASDVCVPGLKVLLHASYELQSNREHFSKEQPHGEEIRKKIGGLTANILKDIPASAALRAFGEIPAAKGNAATDEIEQLQNVFSNTVAQTPFVPVIGGEKVKPDEARIWRHRLGEVLREEEDVRKAKLLDPSLASESDVRDILKELGAEEICLHKHAELLQSCRNNTPDECHAAWKVAEDIARMENKNMASVSGSGSGYVSSEQKEANAALINALKDAPIWWTDKEKPRSLNGDIPLLQERPKDWPDWLDADVLSPEFRKLLTDKVRPKDAAVWPLTPHSYFTGALLPFCEGEDSKWWGEKGWDVLQWAIRWGGANTEKGRKIIYLPTDKGWLPAIQCYAGKGWDGPASFDEYFQGVPDRGVVISMKEWKRKMPPNAEPDKKKYKAFLRNLGVSWGAKIRQGSLDELPSQFSALVNEYKQQCLERIRQRPNRRSARMVVECESLCIEHFPDSLAGCSSSDVFRAVKSIEQSEKKLETPRLKYRYQQGEDWGTPAESFALFQLRRGKWIPCRPGLLCHDNLAMPKDALMPRHGMGILPEIIKGDIPNDEWHGAGGVKEMLKGLGVPEGLPDKPERFHMWMSDLAQYAGRLGPSDPARRWDIQGGEANKQGDIAKAARLLFAAHFKSFPDTPIPPDTPAPFLRKTTKGEFVDFAPARAIFHADKPYFAESNVRAKVLKEEGIKVFPLFLNDSAAKHAGLASLSDKMNMRVVPPNKKPQKETEELRGRYKARRLLLAKAAESVIGKGVSLCEDLEIWASEEITMESSEYPDIRPEIDFWLPEEEKPPVLHVNANGGQNRRWDSLAGGLAKLMGVDAVNYRADFRNFLQEKDFDECLRILRNDPFSLTEEALQELSQESLTLPEVNEDNKQDEDDNDSPPSSSSDTDATAKDEKRDGNNDDSPGTTPASANEEPTSANDGNEKVTRERGHTLSKHQPSPSIKSPTHNGYGGNSYGSEGSSEHRNLCKYVLANPDSIESDSWQVPNAHPKSLEYSLESGDKVDVVFESEDQIIGVEVKAYRSSEADIKRGIYQCIKYQAVLKAQQKLQNKPKQAHTVLVIQDEMSKDNAHIAKTLGVRHVVIPKTQAGN